MFDRPADAVSANRRYNVIRGHGETLFGTPADDKFVAGGSSRVIGGQGGIDLLNYTRSGGNVPGVSTWTLTEDGISGTSTSDGRISMQFSGIDHVRAELGGFYGSSLHYTVESFDPSRSVFAEGDRNGAYLYLTMSESITNALRAEVGGGYTHTNVGNFSDYFGVNITGGSGNDSLISTDYLSVTFSGRGGDDILTGYWGDDVLVGGAGQDVMSGGPSGFQTNTDTFRFFTGDSAADIARADVVKDFTQAEHDRIDLKGYDAIDSTTKIDAFTFIGDAVFLGAAGQLHYEFQGADTLLSGDTDGDAVADFYIRVTGHVALTAADFLFAAADLPVAAEHPFAAHVDLIAHQLLPLA